MMKTETMENLIDRHKTAYVGTVDEDGMPCVKAMQLRGRESLRKLYFSTNLSSATAARLKRSPKACAYFCDSRFFRGVMLQGCMEIITDDDARAARWRAGDERFYPAGPTDPDYCVLCLTIERGRSFSGKSHDFAIEEK